MPDKEKVIRGLKACSACLGSCPPECPYYSHTVSCTGIQLKKDALALLEDRKPIITTSDLTGRKFYKCANCGCHFEMDFDKPRKVRVCRFCGQGVKWGG